MGLYDFTIYSVISRNAFVYPDRLGWVFNDEKVTHAQFKKRVDQLAFGLWQIGIKKEDRIGVLAFNSLNFAYLYGAAARIGAIILPINWRLKPEEIEYVISDGTPKVIFVGQEFQSLIKQFVPQFAFVEKVYSLGKLADNFPPIDELMDNDEQCPDQQLRSDDAYIIVYTAAVNGKPRGATLSHLNLIANNIQSMYIWSLTEKDAHLLCLPMFHVAGLGSAFSAMHSGGTNVVMSEFNAEQALRNIEKYKISFIVEFPPMLSSILDKNEEIKCDISSLRVVAGLEGLETVKRYQNLTGGNFWTAFGQTETSGFVTYAPYFEKPGSAGLPSHMAEVKLINNTGKFVQTDQVGEIVVRGPLIFKGYWNLYKDNEYTFRDGWHHTGDMGRFDQDGYLWYMGRMPEKELIKPGGENVYPAEVEKVILEHPAVQEAVVIGVADQKWGEAIKAVCVLKEGAVLPETDLIDFVASKIARYKKPKSVVFVPELPKNADGSINRVKVKEDHGKV
jgi:acyl-CoA synthetase (AMP-forming)/AMP-acid ligase II